MSNASPPQSNAAMAGGQPAQWPRATRYIGGRLLEDLARDPERWKEDYESRIGKPSCQLTWTERLGSKNEP